MTREEQIQQERKITIQCMEDVLVDRWMVAKAIEMLNHSDEWTREAARRALIRMNQYEEEPKDVWA